MVLHTLSSLDPSVLEKAATPIMKGLAVCTRNQGPLKNEITNTPDFWSVLQNLQDNVEVASSVFDMVDNLVTGQPSAVTADNYEPTVGLLNGFATAASIGAVIEQKRDRSARKQKPSKSARPR